jgi:hypothetical protein
LHILDAECELLSPLPKHIWQKVDVFPLESLDWILLSAFSECVSKSSAAAEANPNILTLDPELLFMSYLLGIYLFHGSFILLLLAERMAHIGFNPSVEHACEVII